MCGIIGIVNHDSSPVNGRLLSAMTASLAHRGPDGFGTELKGVVGFGHRRLSIIDPVGGKQPMFNEDGRVWVTFNGEIYNYRELRSELQGKGHHFVTNSDTETIVHAYEEWGTRCVERFRGMFAFGIMDWREGRLFIARDHFGIKPLYYLQSENSFAFASEIQALRHHPGFSNELDLGAVDQYLRLQYIPAPRTAFTRICKLPPAHCLSVSLDGRTSGPEEYWQLRFRPDHSLTAPEWEEALDATLRESVKAHLVADVPFGAFLSGGVDSSLVVGYMSQVLNKPVKAFSIGFEEEEFNELDYARVAAERWGADHHIEIVKPDALNMLPRLVSHYGDLFGDSSAIPTYYVSQVARKQVPMILSGDGADESFAGYWSYGHWMKKLASPSGSPDNLDDWLSFITYLDNQRRSQLWRPEYRNACPEPLELFNREFGRARDFSPCNKAQYMDLKSYLPYDILTKVDIASMMHGLEVRTPFVDLKVVEFAATIPEHLNITATSTGEWERKLLLKKVGERYFPRDFMHRPKMGFAVPIARWFAPGGELHDVLRERLLGGDSALGELFEPSVMAGLVSRNDTGPLWLLLYLEEWLRQNFSATTESAGTADAINVVTDKAPAKISHVETAENRPTSAEKPRILLIADVPNWIFERHCLNLKRLLSDEFEFTIVYDNQPYDEADYDLIYPLEWYKVRPEAIRDPMKYVSGIRSHLVWTDYTFDELTRYLDTRFNLIHVVSKRLYDIFSPAMQNVRYVSHGIDTDFFTPATSSGQSGKALKLGWAGNRKSVGKKGFAEFIEPLSHLPGVELVFCGYSDRNLTLEEMRDFYNSIDAYICASDFEGNNNSLMEAASMARAIITTDNGTVPEYLRDGENALVVERTLDAFTRAVTTLRDDPALRTRLGADARKAATATWDWKSRGEDYRQLFRSALSRKNQQEQQHMLTAQPAGKRVLIASPFFWPSIGGVEIIAENLGKHLVTRGYRIEVATYGLANRTSNRHAGMTIIPLDQTPGTNGVPKAQAELRRLVETGAYDACILFADPTNWVLWSLDGAAIPAKTRTIVQTVINIDDYNRWRDNTAFRGRLAAMLRSVDQVTVLSPDGPATEYLAAERLPSVYIPNATKPVRPTIDFRSRYSIPTGARLILHVANLWPVKNHPGLLDTLRGMPDNWQLVMIGSPAADGHHAYGQQVMAAASHTPNVTLIPGLPHEEVSAAMATADVVVLSSHGEVSPVTILEAMSHGKPWLATPHCGAVHDHAGGIIAPLNDFQAVLRVLFDTPGLSQKLGAAGYDHWQSCYTWDIVADAWSDMINGTLSANRFSMPAPVAQQMADLSHIFQEALFPHPLKETTVPLPGISFCIITGGKRPDMLELAIRSIRAQKIPAYEIIVIGKHHPAPGITYLPAEEAAGQGRLGAMRNLGVARARYGTITIMDDDIILSTDWYREFARYGDSFDILTSQVRVPDGSRYWDHCTHGGPRGHQLLEAKETDDHLYMTGGGGWVMSSRVAQTIRWDDDRGFYKEEDTTFSSLCRTHGFSIQHNHRMIVYHADGVYTGIGRWVARRSDGRTQEWVEPALANRTETDILNLANEFIERQQYAEAADCVRMGLLTHRSSDRLKSAWREISGNWGGDLSDSRWYPQGDPAFLNTIALLKGMQLPDGSGTGIRQEVPAAALTVVPPAERLSIVWEGPQFMWHSMAHVNRELCLKLIEMGHYLSLIPVGTASFGPETVPHFAPLRAHEHKQLPGEPDVTIRHWYPPNFTPPAAGYWVMMQPWEMGSIPKQWIESMKDTVDELWVYTSYVRECYIRSGFPADRVFVAPIGIDTGLFTPAASPMQLQTRKKWKFLYVGGTTLDRKGFDVLINSYLREFTSNDDVTLVVKDLAIYTGGNNPIARQLRELQSRPGAPEILVMEEDLTPDRLAGLYKACDCLVHSYRGEGFSLPIAEAMAMELPVIVTGHGACLDFCGTDNAYLIPAREVTVPTKQVYGLETVDNPWWAEPDADEFRRLMRSAVNDPEAGKRKGKAGRARILAGFTWEHAARAMQTRLQELRKKPIRRFAPQVQPPVAVIPAGGTKNILMVAPILPTFDRDSGSFRLFQIISLLRQQGHHITFIARGGAGGVDPTPYQKALDDLGVKSYALDPDKLRQLGLAVDAPRVDLRRILGERHYDLAYIYFHHIAYQYMDEIRSISPATRIIVDSVDLHFLREQREAELTGSSKALLKAQQTKQVELGTYAKADMVIAVTEADKQELLVHAPNVSAEVIPNIHPLLPDAPPFDARRDILFVGGFPHTPNVDAVLYFCAEVWPFLKDRLSQARLFLVGNAPPDIVRSLASDRIIVTGYVPETLPYLQQCRVSIAPLRFGAGMKGKVGEALAAGIPVVATSVAAEGTGMVPGRDILVADDPIAFAEAVISVYSQESEWNRLAGNGREFMTRNYSPEALAATLPRIIARAAGDSDHAFRSRNDTDIRPTSRQVRELLRPYGGTYFNESH